MTNTKDLTRRISLDKDKFRYDIDYIFYGFLLSIATARPTQKKSETGKEQWELYLNESKYVKCRPLLRKWMGGVSSQTIRNKLKKAIDDNMILYDKENKLYTFPYDYNGRYYIISRDVIFYLCATTNSLVIQTYIYLASRYAWKQKIGGQYIFTAKEIKDVLGYSAESQNSPIEQLIKAGLLSLQAQGFIDFETVQVPVSDLDEEGYKTQRYVLKKVTTKIMPERLIKEIDKALPELKPKVTKKDIFFIETLQTSN